MSAGAHRAQLILYIEDHEDVYAAMLRCAGFRVAEAPNGVVGVERALSLVPDLVLLDLTLPRGDGYEAMRRIKGHHKTRHIPVMIMTARDDTAPTCDGVLTRPLDADAFLRTVASTLASAMHETLETSRH